MPQNRMTQIEMTQMELTWWTEDGSERKAWVCLAPHSSPETAVTLARMLHLADAEAGSNAKAAGLGEGDSKTLELTLVRVADALGCSVEFLSRLELGQVPDGPMLNLLERLADVPDADVLDMDLAKLVDLKQEDVKDAWERVDRLESSSASMTELERQMLVNFRATTDQHSIILSSKPSRATRSQSYRIPDVNEVSSYNRIC